MAVTKLQPSHNPHVRITTKQEKINLLLLSTCNTYKLNCNYMGKIKKKLIHPKITLTLVCRQPDMSIFSISAPQNISNITSFKTHFFSSLCCYALQM